MRTSRSLSLVIALVSAVLLVVVGGAPAFAGRAPAGVTWITGTLVDASGTPLAGVPVSLTAWPSGAQLAALEPNVDVPTVRVSDTITDETGAFSFQHDVLLDSDLQGLTDGTLIVDLTIEAQAGDQYFSWATSRFLTELVSESGGVQPDEIDDSPITLAPTGTLSSGTGGTEPVLPPGSCPYQKIATLGPRWVAVGAAYTTTGATMKFTYTSGSNTEIGIGVSLNGGPFKASGTSTSTLTNNASIGFPTATGVVGKIWRTQFVFAKFRSICASGTRVEVRAVSFAGGANIVNSTAPATVGSRCVPMPAGSDFTLDYSRASKFVAAVNGDIGIALSSTTGWNAKTKLHYDFAANKHLCGTKTLPGDAPGTLVARP